MLVKGAPGDMPHCQYIFIQLIEISFLLSKLLNDHSQHFKASFYWPFLGPDFLLTPWACVHVVTLQHVFHCHLIQGLLWVKRHTKPLTQWFRETHEHEWNGSSLVRIMATWIKVDLQRMKNIVCKLPSISWRSQTASTRTTRTPAFWGYPPLPHDYPYHWVILDPKSKEDKVKVTNLKNSPKLQIFEFWNGHYMRHTFWSCLIRCANMKWIRWVLLKIQSGHDSVHRRTRWYQYTPLSTSLKRGV